MGESARRQHEIDKAGFEAVKAQSAEDNKEFVEFLHTKGVKAKANLVIENIKKGASEAPARTAAQVAKAKSYAPQTGAPSETQSVSAQTLSDEFNAFLEQKELADKYHVVVTNGEE